MQVAEVTIDGQSMEIHLDAYTVTGAPALTLFSEGEPYARITSNPPCVLPDGIVCVKMYSENAHLREPLLQSGLFVDSGVRIPMGFVQLEAWHLSNEIAQYLTPMTQQ